MYQITKRLKNNNDLKNSIIKISKQNAIKGGIILCAVGSLKQAKIRLAGAKKNITLKKNLEIISLMGRISENGSHVHIHISVADKKGKIIGGHLLEGCIVNTTVELVLLCFENTKYQTTFDKETGFKELNIIPLDN